MTGFASTLATIWRLAVPYFRSPDRAAGFALLAAVISLELAVVAINVLLNWWNARFFNALQDRNWDVFVTELIWFCQLAAAYVICWVYKTYINQWLVIRWRRWMTVHYLTRWLEASNHYRMQLLGDASDNPDQRIQEDIKQFIEYTLYIGIGVLSSVVSFISFVGILWVLSAQAPLRLLGVEWSIPGYLVWIAVVYSIIGTILTHLIGRRLILLNFNQQRFEANFRFNLVRTRENGEQIALLHGEGAEHVRLMDRFLALMNNWYQLMSRQKRLSFFTTSFNQASVVFPYVVATPAYFAGLFQLGGLTQTAQAFNSVQAAVSFFADTTTYTRFADWRAAVDRLAGFERAVADARILATIPPVVTVNAEPRAPDMRLDQLDVRLPDGKPLVAADDVSFAARERVLVTGPSGSGKSTLFRAIAGVWPFGDGAVRVPTDAKVMALPQRPYLPIGSLEAAVSYPANPGAFPIERIDELLRAVGLAALATRLEEEAHWNRMLSLGEQQRIGIARAILHAPDYLLLDEATASLDEPAEANLYRLIRERLPGTTVVSIGHRSTLAAFHDRHLRLEPDGDRNRVRQAAPMPAS